MPRPYNFVHERTGVGERRTLQDSPSAMPRPIPEAAPVTMAICPLSEMFMIPVLLLRYG